MNIIFKLLPYKVNSNFSSNFKYIVFKLQGQGRNSFYIEEKENRLFTNKQKICIKRGPRSCLEHQAPGQ